MNAKPSDLSRIKTEQGEWVGIRQEVKGKSITELLPAIVEEALMALPIPKRMRWGNGDAQFVRPVHSVIMLYGSDVIHATILGVKTSNITRGHRFMAAKEIHITRPETYEAQLQKEGFVIVQFSERRDRIEKQAKEIVSKKLSDHAQVMISSDEFLDEVTGLVEWPEALLGQFDKEFLALPKEVLISSMEDHQRYFPVTDDKGNLLPYFVTISNIESKDPKHVIHGNERVIRARLADAKFFYEMDQKESLEERVERLKQIVFQAELGTMYE